MIFPCPKPEKKKNKKPTFNKKKVAKRFEDAGITSCEVMLEQVKDHSGETPAHKHKRRWYLNKGEAINSLEEIVLACPRCHEIMEKDPILTKEVFERLRP